MDGASWVSWAELASVDPETTPEHFVGRVTWYEQAQPTTGRSQLVPRRWPAEVLSTVGEPPP
ncbi:hypothetical protein [Streptomyces tendae]|uniref:hypothetical protein n=1 Tax=Streptomyces tendae TaxID=1932 RepID=UPI00368E5E11